MDELQNTAHRPYPLLAARWRMRQRWNDLLFAHWPVAADLVQSWLPPGLVVDTFDGAAWLGVVPFWMDRVRVRVVGERTLSVPTVRTFPELNLRTYVRSRRTGQPGVWFYSLDTASPLAVIGARVGFHLPYFPARTRRVTDPRTDEVQYASRRWLPPGRPAETRLRYRPTGPVQPGRRGSLAAFLTERYCLFTVQPWSRALLVGEIHHAPWPLQPADAEWERNGLPGDFGFRLPPGQAPVLHFAKELAVTLWGLRREDRLQPQDGGWAARSA